VELHERTHGDVVVIDVQGRISAEDDSYLVLRDTLRALIEHGTRWILLNVAEVTYVDSVWLGAMVQAYASAVRHGGTVKLLHVRSRFGELLHVTKLDTVFELFESEDEATESFHQPGTRSERSRLQ
jgi:anti-sigma B factor antagonist